MKLCALKGKLCALKGKTVQMKIQTDYRILSVDSKKGAIKNHTRGSM